MNKWLDFDDIYTYDSNNEIIKLTRGQGHLVEGQGQIYNYVKKIGLPIKHERKVGSWYNYVWFISIRNIRFKLPLKSDTVHLWQTGTELIFTRSKCPCLSDVLKIVHQLLLKNYS